MHKRPWRRLTITSATMVMAASALGLSATPSLASSTTWEVSPGGSMAGTGDQHAYGFLDTTIGSEYACASSSLSGSLKSGTGLSGTDIGTIKAFTFGGCQGPLNFSFPTTFSALPYQVNATSYDAATGTTTATITGLHATMSANGCDFTIDGTSSTADDGSVTIKYINKNHNLTIGKSGSTLHLYDVRGCFGLFKSGDAFAISTASYKISPAQTITSLRS
jgi:hypothetical protein